MKTKWLHILGLLIAFSSIFLGIQIENLFVTFSIAIPLMIWWSFKNSPDEKLLKKMTVIEMNAIQRGVEKGLRREETIIVALFIPAILMIIEGHFWGGIFLGLIAGGMALSVLAGELELEKMERIERQILGMDGKIEYPLRDFAKGLFSALKGELSSLWHRETGIVSPLKRIVWIIDAFVDVVIFRKSRSALLDYLKL